MKNLKNIFIIAGLIACLSSCTNNFAELNTNPQVMVDPKVHYLFAFACESTQDGIAALLYEGMEQYMRWSQLTVSDDYEPGSMDMHSRYNNLYGTLLPHLFEIRKIIETYPDKESYMKLWAATFVVQVYATLRVTDVYGSIPYTEAIKGRHEDKLNPVYDTQQTLLNRFYDELTEANRILQDGSLPTQAFDASFDIFFNGDWTKWSRLANSLLLRLATRFEGQDQAKTTAIFRQVMQDPVGPMASENDALRFFKPTANPFGGDIDYRSVRYANRNIVNFMKKTGDLRLGMYFSPNGLVGSFKDTLALYETTLPSFIDLDDPLISYQGGVVNWSDPEAVYTKTPFRVSNASSYALISTINRNFFAPKRNGATGNYTDIYLGYAETCFYIAEFIRKGYGAGFDTKGTAEDWYNKGVRSSFKSMYDISMDAQSFTAIPADEFDTSVKTYLEHPLVKYDAGNGLEQIMIQQYLNFFRSSNEVWAFARRTGYPKFNSAILKREVMDRTIPRRLWTVEPMTLNLSNWENAIREQGFTLRERTEVILASERLWWDKNNPAYGEGK